jgi:hypothetical protein
VLKRIFEQKRDEVIRGWRKLHNKELHNLYPLPSIISMIRSKWMRWAGHVIRMGKKRNADEMGGACNTNGEEEECV